MLGKSRSGRVKQVQHASGGVHTACFRKQATMDMLIAAIQANIDAEEQHGPVKVYSAEERARFAASSGLAAS